ncbi:MAG: hypothetical protein KGL12_05345 [Rhodospirillales bacterium]|nr:hypothetical protein [Rhodospirillales bacterium]
MSTTLRTDPETAGAPLRNSAESPTSGVAWPAVIGGALASLALAVLLVTLGSGLGLASVSPWIHTGASIGTVTVITGIWLIVMHWLASGLGGYLTGRLRTKWAGLHTHEVFFRDTANGFLSWALATLIGVVLIAGATASIVGGAAAIATAGVGEAASSAMQPGISAAIPDAYLLDRLFRTDHPGAAGGSAEARKQAGQIIANGLASGMVPAADTQYLAGLVASRTGLTPDQTAKRVAQLMAGAKTAEAKAVHAVDAARKATATLAIFTGLAMLIGAFVACAAAALGGQHRDLHA